MQLRFKPVDAEWGTKKANIAEFVGFSELNVNNIRILYVLVFPYHKAHPIK